MKNTVPPLSPFLKKIKAMMKDDPRLIAVESETDEEVTQRLEDLGIIKDGKVTESYKRKFKGSRAPNLYHAKPTWKASSKSKTSKVKN